jgi:undecaprenyl-diphosphatase
LPAQQLCLGFPLPAYRLNSSPAQKGIFLLDIYHAIVLGVIQGLTEFLPVSSSGHLVLFQHLFGLRASELLFDIGVHVGTLAAIGLVFYREIGKLLMALKRLPQVMRRPGRPVQWMTADEDTRMLFLIGIGSIPTAILGLILSRVAAYIFSSVWLVGAMLIVTGSLLWLTRRLPTSGRVLSGVSMRDALLIGLVQGLAILPGISRSGTTIATALLLGIDREVAGRYSFLLSIPAILGALLLGLDAVHISSTASVGIIVMGSAIAGIVGYAALRLLLAIVRRGQLSLFSPYCWLIGMITLIISWTSL